MALLHTKYSKLVEHAEKLEKSGFIIPPMRKIKCAFYDHDTLRAENELFLKQANPLFPPVTVIRNNGIPRGAGIGTTKFIQQSADFDKLSLCHYEVKESDKDADGVLFQQFGGMEMKFGNTTAYAPIISGIAYTGPCTKSGSIMLNWVYGHLKGAVEGKGNYYSPLGEDPISDMQIRNEGIYALEKHSHHPYLNPLPLFSEYQHFMCDYRPHSRDLIRDISKSVEALGKDGAFYMEWAAIVIDGTAHKIALQVAEVTDTLLAGLDNKTQALLDNFDKSLEIAFSGKILPLAQDIQSRYDKAIFDPNVVAVGFDVVGRKKQTYDSLVYLRNDRKTAELLSSGMQLFLIEAGEIYLNESSMKIAFGRKPIEKTSKIGIVEAGHSTVRTSPANGGHSNFRGHMHGFFTEKGITGLSGTQFMKEKLLALVPGQPKTLNDAIMRGKFVLDVDESVPIGTLRVESIDSVEELKKEY